MLQSVSAQFQPQKQHLVAFTLRKLLARQTVDILDRDVAAGVDKGKRDCTSRRPWTRGSVVKALEACASQTSMESAVEAYQKDKYTADST